MSTIEVDTRALEAAAATARAAGEELREVAQRLAAALVLVGGAGGSATLAGTAAEAARRWRLAVEGYAEVGVTLGRATEQAAAAYRLMEFQTARVLTPVVFP